MGFSEMLLLAFLGYVLLGPRKTAELARELGRHVDHWKRAAGELQEQFYLPPEAMGSETVNDKRQTIIGELNPGVTVYGTDNNIELPAAPVTDVTTAPPPIEPLQCASFSSAIN